MPLTDSYSNDEIVEITGSINLKGVSGSFADVLPNGSIPVSVVSGAFSGSFEFPDVQEVTGSVSIDEQPIQVTGSIGISEVVDITGSVKIDEQPVNITGSIGVSEVVSVTGSVVIGEQPVNVTGSIRTFSDPNDPTHVTGSVVLGEQPIDVTGSVRVFSDPNDPTHITGSVTTGNVIVSQKNLAVAVDYFSGSLDSTLTHYLLLLDLDNAGGAGPYKHATPVTSVKGLGFASSLLKSKTGADWEAVAGVILDIDGTEATIAWLEIGSLHAANTSLLNEEKRSEVFPADLDLTVSGSDFLKVAAGFKETTTDVNTGISLPDVGGTLRTPAVGDFVIRVLNNSGGGTASIHYFFHYVTE